LRFFLNIDDLWDEQNNDWKSLKEFINMLGMKTKEKRTIIIYFIPPPMSGALKLMTPSPPPYKK
jgi:hypothetical protein